MTVTYGFYDSVSSDRLYDAKQFGSIFDGIIEDGVYAGLGDKLIVVEDSPAGMDVIIGSGRAWFNHTWTLNDADLAKTIATADALLNRIDVVYLEINEDSGTRVNSFAVLTGTPASSPVAPTLTQTSTLHQYPLAHVYVGAAVTSIVQDDITNKVGMTATPFVAGIIDYVTTNELLIQWEAQWETWFDSIKDQLSSEAETNLQAQIWDLAGVESGAPPYASDMVTLAAHDHDGTDTPQLDGSGIESSAISSSKLSTGAVIAGKIAAGGVSAASQLASGIVEAAKLASGAVTSSKLGSNAVIAGKIADGAVDVTAALANDIVDDTKVGNRVIQMYRRKGGSASGWSDTGTTVYTPGKVRMQCGSQSIPNGGGNVVFPVSFGNTPLVFINFSDFGDNLYADTWSPSQFHVTNGSGVSLGIHWLAIGPE